MATAFGNTVPLSSSPVEIFYSYSHKDEKLRAKLENHLSILRRQGFISGWHDRKITAGSEWAGEIDQHLNSARIILLLISSDFVASDYCYDLEMGRAMQRHESGEAYVIPVILRPVDWSCAPFGKLQGLPKDGKPVTKWSNPDEAFENIAVGIRNVVTTIAEVGSIDRGQPPKSTQPFSSKPSDGFAQPRKNKQKNKKNKWSITQWRPWAVTLAVLIAVGAIAWRANRSSNPYPDHSDPGSSSSPQEGGSAIENGGKQSPSGRPNEPPDQPQEQNQKPQEAPPQPKMRVLHSATPSKTDLALNPKGRTMPRAGRRPSLPTFARAIPLKMGGEASVRPNGQIRSIQANGMSIKHGLRGGRTIESTRGGSLVVSTGRGAGYVQRAYVTRGGHAYYSRTYYDHGTYHTGVYRSYSYGGKTYYGYVPAYYYHSDFYGWAYTPWPAPVFYGWNWGGAPWFGYYGNYFAPYPVYPGASFWLTDYLLAANLKGAYASTATAEANAAAENAAAENNSSTAAGDEPQASGPEQSRLTFDDKQAIAEEVKAQLASEQVGGTQESAGGQSGGQSPPPPEANMVPPALDPARRTFVVSSDLTVLAEEKECVLTAGDVITRLTDTPDPDGNVKASVASSKKSDCAPSKQVTVSVEDLQEMYNNFQEKIDEGLRSLAAKQGTGGLPKAPDTATVSAEVPPPPPETTAAKLLEDQQKVADELEIRVKSELHGEAPKD